MTQSKWLKLCATAFLSIGILAACGNDSDAPDLEGENIDVEEDESVPTDGGTDADGSPGGDDNDNADTDEDSEDDSED